MKKNKLSDMVLPSGRKLGDVTTGELKAETLIKARRALTLEHYTNEFDRAALSGVGVVKTTVRLPRSLWQAARKRGIDEGTTFESLVLIAIAEYLRLPEGVQERAEAKAKEFDAAEKRKEGSR
jgi:hypothetical protein